MKEIDGSFHSICSIFTLFALLTTCYQHTARLSLASLEREINKHQQTTRSKKAAQGTMSPQCFVPPTTLILQLVMLAYHRAIRIGFLFANHWIQAELLHALRELLGERRGLGLRMHIGGRYDHHHCLAFNEAVVATPPSQHPSTPFCPVHDLVPPLCPMHNYDPCMPRLRYIFASCSRCC
jgi:hypothetical protein